MSPDYKVGNYVRFKKTHPCGGDTWKIIRVGMDFKVECTTCHKVVMFARRKFEKAVKEKINKNDI